MFCVILEMLCDLEQWIVVLDIRFIIRIRNFGYLIFGYPKFRISDFRYPKFRIRIRIVKCTIRNVRISDFRISDFGYPVLNTLISNCFTNIIY
ncbi:hypothetical protein Hanom_Chr15g01368811 [Helianthus anomalus]